MKKVKSGFTIVELLMVIGIIGVLTGIVTTAASNSVKSSRAQKRKALCAVVEAGLATYYAKEGKWPITDLSHRTNKEGDDRTDDPYKRVLTGLEVQKCVKELAQKTKEYDPVMDVSGLFVSRYPGKFEDKYYGMDFMTAIKGSRKNTTKLKLEQMYFGYPEDSHGYFRHFKIIYSIPADSMIVTAMDSNAEMARFYE